MCVCTKCAGLKCRLPIEDDKLIKASINNKKKQASIRTKTQSLSILKQKRTKNHQKKTKLKKLI